MNTDGIVTNHRQVEVDMTHQHKWNQMFSACGPIMRVCETCGLLLKESEASSITVENATDEALTISVDDLPSPQNRP